MVPDDEARTPSPEKRTQQRVPVPEQAGGADKRSQLTIFVVLLAAMFAMTVLFASGVLRFGLSGPFIYVLYVIAGLLASTLCYGILDSFGELHGTRYGITLRLGGAIVGLVVVAGGGGLYERFLQTPSTFNVRVYLHEGNTAVPVGAKGTLSLRLGSQQRTVNIEADGTALFQGITSDWEGKQVGLVLSSVLHELHPDSARIKLSSDGEAYARIVSRPMFVEEEDAEMTLKIIETRSTKMAEGFEFDRDLSFVVRAVCRSPRRIPIDAAADLEITDINGVLRQKIPLTVSSDLRELGAFLKPNLPTNLFLEGKFFARDIELLDMGHFSRVVLHYDRVMGTEARPFMTAMFEFNRQHLDFDEDQ